MANTNTKRSADLKLDAVIESDGDKTEFIFLGVGYRNKKGSMTFLLSNEWQLVNKNDGWVLEAVTATRGDGSEYNARVKILARATKAGAAKVA